MDRERFDFVVALYSYNRCLGPVCHYGRPLPFAILLRQIGQMLGDGWQVVGVQIVRVRVRFGFAFVANYVIPVWGGLVEWVLEELRNEGC